MTTVQQVLRDAIAAQGSISFYEFMRLALYHPLGYYNQKVRIGGAGADFYTSAQSPLFGRVLARALLQIWRTFGEPDALQVVEMGAGQGELAEAVCTYLEMHLPRTVNLSYCIVEQSQKFMALQQKKLLSANRRAQISWGHPHAATPTVLVANELLDALPVERLRRAADGNWERAFVTMVGETFDWVWRAADNALSELAARWLPIRAGEMAELSPDYPALFADIASFGRPLHAFLLDYGTFAEEWEAGVRPEGTLRGFCQHQLVDPLFSPGDADITADAHWDYAADAARRAGFRHVQVQPQRTFLFTAGIAEEMQNLSSRPDLQEYRRAVGQFKQLVLPGGMGDRFSVLECTL